MSSGLSVAAAAWVRALAQHGAVSRLEAAAPLWELDWCRDQLCAVTAGLSPTGVRVDALADSSLPARLRDHPYDVFHDPANLDLARASYARARFSSHPFPITASQHGISSAQQLYPPFIRLLTAQLHPCDAIVCLTNAARTAMKNRLQDTAERYCGLWDRPPPPLPRLEVIPWGVDTDRFAPRDQGAARRDLDLPAGRTIILCLGRLRIQDKMDWTPPLLAFERVLREVDPAPLLVLAGANPFDYGEQILSHARQLGIHGHLRTFFNLPPACLPSLYAACDILLSPTDTPSESFGLTIAEAMASGRPVVASDWDGYKELILHGVTGFKVRTDWVDCLSEVNEAAPLLRWDHAHLHVGQSVSIDIGQMAGYLADLLRNPDRRQEMGRRARERALAHYDWRAVIPQWESLWSELGTVARSLAAMEPDGADFAQPNHFRQFAHYASRIIDDAIEVQLTTRGKQFLGGNAPLFLHAWARGYLEPELLRATLLALKPTGWLGAGVPIGHLVGTMQKKHGLGREKATMHLMWLAKYDLVSFSDGKGRPS